MKVALTSTLALTLTCLVLSACGRGEEPAASNAATPAVRPVPAQPAQSQNRIQTAVVE